MVQTARITRGGTKYTLELPVDIANTYIHNYREHQNQLDSPEEKQLENPKCLWAENFRAKPDGLHDTYT